MIRYCENFVFPWLVTKYLSTWYSIILGETIKKDIRLNTWEVSSIEFPEETIRNNGKSIFDQTEHGNYQSTYYTSYINTHHLSWLQLLNL